MLRVSTSAVSATSAVTSGAGRPSGPAELTANTAASARNAHRISYNAQLSYSTIAGSSAIRSPAAIPASRVPVRRVAITTAIPTIAMPRSTCSANSTAGCPASNSLMRGALSAFQSGGCACMCQRLSSARSYRSMDARFCQNQSQVTTPNSWRMDTPRAAWWATTARWKAARPSAKPRTARGEDGRRIGSKEQPCAPAGPV